MSALTVRLQSASPVPLDVSFECGEDDLTVIFGPSGAGKTTMLRCIAGLHPVANGRVTCGDAVWLDTAARVDLPPYRRDVGFVFQDYALFPHMTAAGNVAAALGAMPARERRREALRLLDTVGLPNVADRRPATLSGGERQRLALARAIARRPRVLLLDEPFVAVDRVLRQRLRSELRALQRELRVPVVLVTHDFNDVTRLATHMVAIDAGRTVASGTLADLTSRPDLMWLRDAVGLGSVLAARVDRVDETRGLALVAAARASFVVAADGLSPGQAVTIRIPARDVILASERPTGLSLHNILDATIVAMQDVPGSHQAVVQLEVGGVRLLAEVTRDAVRQLDLAPGRPILALIKSVGIEVVSTIAL